MTLKSSAVPELFINGSSLPLERNGEAFTAKLPGADSPARIVALRIESKPGLTRGAALDAPITFKVGPGRIPLGSWYELGLPHYCGGLLYSTEVTLPQKPSSRFILDLGRVRGTAEVSINGQKCGTRIWHPYRFDITEAVTAGDNKVEIRVFNTLGPHFGAGHPSSHVFDDHLSSGIFGPVSASVLTPVEFTLTKTRAGETEGKTSKPQNVKKSK